MIPGSQPIEKTVLKKITATTQQRKKLQETIKSLKKQVMIEIEKTSLPITIELVGSIAKDTYIQNAVDIDLFLMFPPNTSRNTLQEVGLTIGRSILSDQEECFAEHPYVRGMFQGYKTEIVPCYAIESASQKLSAVDRTPLHTKYVRTHLKSPQKNEVRLFKQFLKGIGCYGAEAEIEGFSGYLCEIIILRYKTFQQTICAGQQWVQGETLTLTKGNVPPFSTPLIFIDPVDPERNVASALSKEKFDLFKTACAAYLQKPRITFFFPNKPAPWSLEKIKKKILSENYLGIVFQKPEIISENLHPQIRKSIRSITEECDQQGFRILDAYYHVTDTTVYLILRPAAIRLSKTILHQGPPLTLKKNTEEFINRWKNDSRTRRKPFEKDNRLYVEIEREYTDIHDLLRNQLKKLSLGKHIDIMIRKGFFIVGKEELLSEELRLFWTIILDPRMPWEY